VRTRVVVTGIGALTPIGRGFAGASAGLRADRSAVVRMAEWEGSGLKTLLAAPVELDLASALPRRKRRTMGRVAALSAIATTDAIEDAGLEDELIRSGRVGIAYGSTHGSTTETEQFSRTLFEHGFAKIPGTQYLKFMSNTCAVNLAVLLGVRGPVLSSCSACVSASQAIGLGIDLIRGGRVDVMLCGGAEEMCYIHAGVFDLLFAASTMNDSPDLSPRPFDVDRDGLVVGEGACTLVLESYERAAARGAHIYGEIVGYGTSCDGTHVTAPSSAGMALAMELALRDAELSAEQIDYVNAHATGTQRGDIAESVATYDVFGAKVPVSSTKGNTGHTLGACGTIESLFCFASLADGVLPASRNLTTPDPECAPIDLLRQPREVQARRIMNNNFAFGGINTSLIFAAV
jgi:3-oxoacyl-[acyl-carrier-protein] synthase II